MLRLFGATTGDGAALATLFCTPAAASAAAFPPLPLPQPQAQQAQQQAPAPAPARSAAGAGGRARSASAGRKKKAGPARRGKKAAACSDSDASEEHSGLEEEEDESDQERAALAEARKERLRAKNRRAQARYRQKQKNLLAEQHTQYEAAQADLEREMEANRRLREQGAALEKIASFKDLSLQALEEGTEAPGLRPAAGSGRASDCGATSQPRPARQITTEALLRELAERESRGRAATRASSASDSAAAAAAPPPVPQQMDGMAQQTDSSGGAAAVAASSSAHVLLQSAEQQQQQQQGTEGTGAQSPAALQLHVTPASSGSSGAASTGGASSSASGLRQLPFEQRAVEVVSVMCPGMAAAASELAAAAGAAGAPVLQQLTCRASGVLLASSPQSVRALLQQEVMAMSEQDFLQDWEDFGKLAAETIAELDACRIVESVAAARLKPAVTFRALLHTLMLHHRPDIYRRLLGHTRMPEDTPEQTAARWRQAALAMGCTRAQAVQLRQRYDEYCAKLARLSRECQLSMRALTRAAEEAQQQLGPTTGGSFLADVSLRSMMQQYLRLYEAAKQLSKQPDTALVVLLELHVAAGAILSEVQRARCAAMYRPLFPDIVAIVRSCLEQNDLLPPGQAVALQ
ncbi:hypothetical protein ABPG75_003704 [Micractinium tetrahymenae]